MKKEVIEALHTIEAWAEEDPKNHVFLTVLYDKSGEKTDTFAPFASGGQKDIATALAYTAYQNPDFEHVLKVVAATLPQIKAIIKKRTKNLKA